MAKKSQSPFLPLLTSPSVPPSLAILLTALGVLRMLPVLQRLDDAYTVSSSFDVYSELRPDALWAVLKKRWIRIPTPRRSALSVCGDTSIAHLRILKFSCGIFWTLTAVGADGQVFILNSAWAKARFFTYTGTTKGGKTWLVFLKWSMSIDDILIW